MNPRRLLALLSALVVLGLAGQAFALDAYRDRRGMYYGLGIGGGANKFDTDKAENRIGFHLRGRVGGGISQNLTLDGELGWRIESYEQGAADVTNQFLTLYVGANYFVTDGLYIRGMGGLAHLLTSVEVNLLGAKATDDDSETGLGVGAGAG
ncbi:MAG: outer membrane beta-barrel protein, partial [Myxococcales bacterium]|nr:outer membrane beta-barrel protein [Myxococcales bacterium]